MVDWNYWINAVAVIAPQLIGFLIPPLVTVVNQKITNSKVKFMMTMLVCFVVAGLLNIQKLATSNSWVDIEAFLNSLLLMFSESQVVYRLYFKGSTLEAKIETKLQPKTE